MESEDNHKRIRNRHSADLRISLGGTVDGGHTSPIISRKSREYQRTLQRILAKPLQSLPSFRSIASLSTFDVSLSELESYFTFVMNKQARYADLRQTKNRYASQTPQPKQSRHDTEGQMQMLWIAHGKQYCLQVWQQAASLTYLNWKKLTTMFWRRKRPKSFIVREHHCETYSRATLHHNLDHFTFLVITTQQAYYDLL